MGQAQQDSRKQSKTEQNRAEQSKTRPYLYTMSNNKNFVLYSHSV